MARNATTIVTNAVDQATAAAATTLNFDTGGTWWASPFVPTQKNLTQVDCTFVRVSGSDSITIEIQTDNGGLPSGTVLATQTVASDVLCPLTSTQTVYTFNVPCLLVTGAKYWICLKGGLYSSRIQFYYANTATGIKYGEGNFTDASNANIAIRSNTRYSYPVTASARTSASARKDLVPYCLDFDGSEDYTRTGTSSVLEGTDGIFTVEFWCMFDTVGDFTQNQAMVCKWAGNNGYMVTTGTGRSMYFYAAGQAVTSTTNTLTSGVWRHIACVCDGSFPYIYINGVLDKKGAALSGSQLGNGVNFELGRYGASYFDGKLAEIRFWNKALDVEDLLLHTANAKDTTSANTAGCTYAANCKLHYPMTVENGTGTNLIDASASGLNSAFGASTAAPSFATPSPVIVAKRRNIA